MVHHPRWMVGHFVQVYDYRFSHGERMGITKESICADFIALLR